MSFNREISEEIRKRLFENSEEEYRDFQLNLMPGFTRENVIGVSSPIVKKLAAEYAKHPRIENFLSDLPHEYYDENNLHGYIIAKTKDFDRAVGYVNAFLPYIDNWATCDVLKPTVFGKNKERLLPHIDGWLKSEEPFTRRFGIEMLMNFYLDGDFKPEINEKAASVQGDEYYVKMMVAWYFATALAKQWDSTVGYVENRRLSQWVHNKTIQKAVESYRITDEQKTYLRTLKIK